jgi:hypothetical protein
MANYDQITAFLNVFTSGKSSHDKVQDLVNLFCGNGNDNWGNPIPAVGITDHGPQFINVAGITLLFSSLFDSFPNIVLQAANIANAPPNYPPFLFSPSAAPPYAYTPPTIGLQTTLVTGPLKKPWFPNAGDPHHSPPLSPIAGNLGAPGVTIPACCIFTFNANSKIMQLAVYMDRYRLLGLQPGGHAILAALGKATKEALELFEKNTSK